MSLRAYSEINLHITWHVKDNNPVLTDMIEAQAQRFLRGRVMSTPEAVFHEVGGTDDHVHLVVSLPPNELISEWIGKLKGASSCFINHEIATRQVLQWQAGYGVVVFGTKDLPWVVGYVRNQRRHHAEGRVVDRLERTEPAEPQTGQDPVAG
ncbi:MAG: IS200/IS605 family transposase [Phycisphaerae bacterium]|nr:IS200/IS605 family transposase [Phycisphaerae bacterium]